MFQELKEQDKDEILLKKVKAEGQEKGGSKQVEVQRKMALILAKYDLTNAVHEPDQKEQNSAGSFDEQANAKRLFKNKKLDKLWSKAVQRHFNEQELKLLKEEFRNMESKLDDYHLQMERVGEEQRRNEENDKNLPNSIDPHDQQQPKKSSGSSGHQLNELHEKHREVKQHFNRLEERVLRDLPHSEHPVMFEEPRVVKLWKLATKSGFDGTELKTLKEELEHFEKRVKKLVYMEEHFPINNDVFGKPLMDKHVDVEENKHLRGRVVELTRHVDKLERDLEAKIMSKHIEL